MNTLNPPSNTSVCLRPVASAQQTTQTIEPTTLPSQALLRGHKTVTIEHNGTVYRLQSTRAGKLILTK
jgi:hemin uptake protein HemP